SHGCARDRDPRGEDEPGKAVSRQTRCPSTSIVPTGRGRKDRRLPGRAVIFCASPSVRRFSSHRAFIRPVNGNFATIQGFPPAPRRQAPVRSAETETLWTDTLSPYKPALSKPAFSKPAFSTTRRTRRSRTVSPDS